ncbi:Uncharacterized membrane protein [Variovorax sp. YR750]|uniref:anthrone oxygenase family protein n=1 Tax=Variovorax sp. YR750 TaxID=1884384 RepID=UPI0008B07525|nr:anthrone oxygenase family protein [Variovorax sp. YR750]SEL42519.1 Uncharacterized membrane protein [Variovorax sp. YR750]
MSFLNAYVLPLTVLAALGSGLIAGLFFTFSNTIMKALSRMPPEQGMAAMQHINVVILNPVFLGIFVGTAVLGVVLGLRAVLTPAGWISVWLIVGALAYVVGSFALTRIVNVPMNDALARADATAAVAAVQWPAYVEPWLRWNHVRTVASIVAALAFTLAAVQMSRATAA